MAWTIKNDTQEKIIVDKNLILSDRINLSRDFIDDNLPSSLIILDNYIYYIRYYIIHILNM